jgi:hypothetical protein
MKLWRYISTLLLIGITFYVLACAWLIGVLFVWVMHGLHP